MFYVIGNSPKKVELKDLNDCIYYKQQKDYTDIQYENSVDLKRAIERRALIVLKKSEDTTRSFDPITPIVSSESELLPEIPTEESVPDQKVDILLERIKILEKSLRDQSSSKSNDALLVILDRLEKLESNSATTGLSFIQDALKGIEAKIAVNSSEGILEKLEGIISRSGTNSSSSNSSAIKEDAYRREEEIYVPSIRVEDANSHINLEVRTINSGDNVADSLRKLKELRLKSK